MTDAAPFRERPKFLLCPRCGEMLERAFEAVLTCLRCEGLWIASGTLEKAFGDPRWPRGPTMWWRNSLECPECASVGEVQAMTAVQAGDVVVDRCASHGLWLDRTELCRLMGGDPGAAGASPDLAVLRAQLEVPDEDLEQLARRRDAWRNDLGLRRKAAHEYRAWLEAEQRRRLEAAAALEQAERERLRQREQEREQEERSQRERERRQAQEREREAQQRAEQERERSLREAERERKREEVERSQRRAEARRERARVSERLGTSRRETSKEIGRIETLLIMLRDRLRATEAELDGARARLRAIDDQIEELRARPE